MSEKNVSVLIPTMNRPGFLRRALAYYTLAGFKGTVVVGDSSQGSARMEVEGILEGVSGPFRLVHGYFSPAEFAHDGMVMKALVDMADTSYVVYSGDDDFITPGGMRACAGFLDENPAYGGARGHRVSIVVDGDGEEGTVLEACYVPQPGFDMPVPISRWKAYMRYAISPQYCVYRREVWKQAYEDIPKVPARYLGPELLPCSLMVVRTRIKELDVLLCVFQENPDNIVNVGNFSVYDLIVSKEWPASVRAFREAVVSALMEEEGIGKPEAEALCDRELWRHLKDRMRWQFAVKYGEGEGIKDKLRKIPGVMALARAFGVAAPAPERGPGMSLEELSSPSSPYQKDFALARDVVEGRGNGKLDANV